MQGQTVLSSGFWEQLPIFPIGPGNMSKFSCVGVGMIGSVISIIASLNQLFVEYNYKYQFYLLYIGKRTHWRYLSFMPSIWQ